MLKNVASQKIALFAFTAADGTPKAGDAAQMTFYVNKDWAGLNALGDTSASELSSTNAPGWYLCDVTQAETNGDALHFTGKSSTSGVVVVGQLIFTDPPNYTLASIDGSGRLDIIKVAGTTQTARDLGTSVLLSSGTGTGQLSITSGVVDGNVTKWNGTAVASPATAGYPAVTVKVGTGTGELNLTSGAIPVKGNIKKNTALTAFAFMMTDSTNHNPAASLTVTCTRSIDGGAFGAGTLANVTEVGVGIYVVDFGAGDLNGNTIILRATATASDDTFVRISTFVA